MLKHTSKIREMYEDIQRKIFYMIPENWEELYLYTSIIDRPGKFQTGELFFYYIPKGILRKNPINVYEIPAKFNLDENEYLKLVDILYDKIKELREEFKKTVSGKVWSNLTLSIENVNFRIIYDYTDLENNEFSSYERHVIWRYEYLGIGMEQSGKEEKQILKKYLSGPKTLGNTEKYESGIYIKDIKNIVDYVPQSYESTQNVEYIASKDTKTSKNQILLSQEEINKLGL